MDSQTIPSSRERLRAQVQATLAGRYRLERELGYGGMAVVYLAENLDFQRMVAIKVMRPEKGYEDGVAERFRTEAVSIARLRHPHIIGVHARGEEADILWFEMDFVPGESLEALIQSGPLAVNRVARYLSQSADALSFAHSQGIIHRDIKPSNLLVDASTDYLVVTDFGIAKIIGKTSLTETGMTVGTLAYMSPEQLSADQSLTSAADQYSLGVVAYECIAGERPYCGGSVGELVVSQVTHPAPSLAVRHPDCPPDLALLVQRMLALDPEARWPDLGVVKIAAAEIALTGEAPSLRGIPAAPQHRKQIRRRALAASVGTTIVLLISAAFMIPGVRLNLAAAGIVGPIPSDTGTASRTPALPTPIPPAVPPDTSQPPTLSMRLSPSASVSRSQRRPDTSLPSQKRASTEPDVKIPVTADTTLAQPAAATATLRIKSVLPGTFVYINGSTKPISISDGYVDLIVPAGRVDLRISSNQPGCTSRLDQLLVHPGELKPVQRNADCPP